MGAHYLVPQVDGGQRKLKGFERAIGEGELVPALGAKLNQYGNVSPGQIRQILSVLGKAEASAGYSANITSRSRRRNRHPADDRGRRFAARQIDGPGAREKMSGNRVDPCG